MPRRAAVPLLIAISLALSACPADTAGPDAPSVTPEESLTPQQGGRLSVAVRNLTSLDPAKAGDRGSINAISHLFEPLTRIDPQTNRVVPGAARRWKVSKDGLTWRFFLRDHRFHNGMKVRARDFVFAFNRIARRRADSEAAFQLEQVRGFRAVKIEGARNELTGLQARGDVLVIRLARPFSELAYNLTHPTLGPLPQKKYRRSLKGIRRSPVGNGPFRVKEASARRALLVRSDRWNSREPYLDEIEYRLVRRIEDGWRLYRAGTVHVAEVPPTAIDGGTALFGQGGFTPYWATLTFGLNTRRKIFRKPEVRRAISLAIDREAIVATVYGNTRDPATGIIPAGVRGYVPGACEACVKDLDRARQVLAAAFGPKTRRIRLDYLKEASSDRVAKAIAAHLRRMGLRIKLFPHKEKRYLKVLEEGRLDITQLGWLSDVPSPDPFLFQQLRTKHLNNHTHWSNSRFDRHLDRARRERNEARRLEHYMRAERIALREMPMIPIVFFRNRTAVAPEVHGLALDGAGLFDGTRVWIEA